MRERGVPAGFLLFARNIESPEQVAALADELAEACGFRPLIAVDQEGGRVQRLHFAGRLPPARQLGDWYAVAPEAALEATFLHGFLLASELRAVGANWVLGPVLDLALPQTHQIIGDRAFAAQPERVVTLAKAWADGVRAGGCLRCIKHAPGHGRAVADSHAELPIVAASADELLHDMAPFAALAPQVESVMTAHIRYPALDNEVATYSGKIMNMMRQEWGFEGLVLADDVGMKALDGDYSARITRALQAGCDVAIAALSQVQAGMAGTLFAQNDWATLRDADIPTMQGASLARLDALEIPQPPAPEQVAEMRARFLRLWADGPRRMG